MGNQCRATTYITHQFRHLLKARAVEDPSVKESRSDSMTEHIATYSDLKEDLLLLVLTAVATRSCVEIGSFVIMVVVSNMFELLFSTWFHVEHHNISYTFPLPIVLSQEFVL